MTTDSLISIFFEIFHFDHYLMAVALRSLFSIILTDVTLLAYWVYWQLTVWLVYILTDDTLVTIYIDCCHLGICHLGNCQYWQLSLTDLSILAPVRFTTFHIDYCQFEYWHLSLWLPSTLTTVTIGSCHCGHCEY